MTTLTTPAHHTISPWLPHPAVIRAIKKDAPGIQTYELEFTDSDLAAKFRFQAGQFNMLYLPGIGEAAISISSDPARPATLAHTIRAAGNVTQALARRRVGDQIGLRGPYGSAWPLEQCRGHDVVIASGGVGLAPLRPVLYAISNHRAEYGRVILLYGARTPADLLYTDEYDRWRQHDIEIEVTVDIANEAWRGHIGVVPVLFYRLRLSGAKTRLLTCGPEVMIRFVIFEALARKVKPEHIYLSMERNMQCAIGLCGHCQLGPAFVCKDGPVFTYQQMEPYLHVEDL
jgi:NAD(P)H-flavin reductase